MSVLITGGTGFIGSHFARKLLNKGYTVVLLDIKIKKKLIKDIVGKIKIVKGDVTSPTQLVEAVKAYDVKAIIHYAALLSSEAEANPELAYRVNFDGLWNIFETARRTDIKAVLFASSIAAYGPEVPQIVKEDTYTIPSTLYGISKQLGEMLGLWFYRKYGIGYAAFRYGSVIGPGRRDGGASAYSTLTIQRPAQGDPYVINVPENSRIPVVYIKDAADATLTAYERIEQLKTRIYNLASLTSSPTSKDIAEAVRKHVPDSDITFKPDAKISEIVKSWPRDLDTTRAEQEISWKPKHSSLGALVADFVKEVRLHPDMYTI